jgi:Ca2+-binding EF-hand superfamily protein
MFTKQQVLDILKEIDEDKTDTIDFFECLQACFVFTIKLSVE